MVSRSFLCSGVSWHPDGAVLAFATPDGGPVELPLTPPGGTKARASGIDLGFRIRSAHGERHCLGFHRVQGPDSHDHQPCPQQTLAGRGYQCGSCFVRDDLRFMHDVHRSGTAPEGLLRYLAQEHWLYVATFADGATKVGTASGRRKWHRLAEQGAVVARYVALADDGRLVRVLEDAVTRNVGLQQAVRSAAKAEALSAPLDGGALEDINGGFAAAARGLLRDGVDLPGFRVVSEQWAPPSSWARVLTSQGSQVYPHSLEGGEHGFAVDAVVGSTALVSISGSSVPFLVDLSRLKGKRIELGPYRSAIPEVQETLF